MVARLTTLASIGRRIALGTFLLGLAACGGPDRDTALNDVPKSDEAKQEIRKSLEGVLTTAESDCVGDKILANKTIKVGQVLDFAKHPTGSGPVFDAYKAAFVACVDPKTKLPPKRAEGEIRDSVVLGLHSAIPSLTDEQATCLIDHLYDAGIGVRELTLSGYFPETLQTMQPQLQAAGQACLS